jgi:hypothetical protein
VTGQWLSPGTPISSTNKTDRHDITEILLKVALSTINQTSCILNENSSKLCKLVYCHMKIRIWLWQFHWTIFEGVIALFDLEYFNTIILHFKFITVNLPMQSLLLSSDLFSKVTFFLSSLHCKLNIF